MNIVIKKANIEDYSNFNIISKEVSDLHKDNVWWFFRYNSFPKDKYNDIINNQEAFFYLAIDWDKVVWYIIAFKRKLDAYNIKDRDFMFIEDFWVLKSYQWSWIWTLLLNKIEDECKNHWISDLELNVWLFNNSAINFYNKKWFNPYSQKMRKVVL